MQRRETLLAVGGALAGTILPSIAGITTTLQEKAEPPFAIDDTAGKRRTLEKFKGKIVVLEWTSPSCPFVRAQYVSGEMQGCKGRGVALGARDPQKAVAFNQGRKAQPTALLMDSAGQMVHANTPHIFIINGAEQIAYAGAIDTQPTIDESIVPKSRNLMRAALEDLLTGRSVVISRTTPYGCLAGYST